MVSGQPAAVAPKTSMPSCEVEVTPENELLVRGGYVQSAPSDCEASTQWFLNGRRLLTSYVAGLTLLTRYRATRGQKVVVSSSTDPLAELVCITIPQGAALVLLPRHIVGVLQPLDQPVIITSHWRLFTLHAWLTFQLRYLVFHGPATLILQGCRGVRIESCEMGRTLSADATIGFSANLAYGTRRSDTFWEYFRGTQRLLNDYFPGGNGFYLYQEVPRRERGAGGGHWLDGVMDALLKPFGV